MPDPEVGTRGDRGPQVSRSPRKARPAPPDVSRETHAPAPPDYAARYFADHLTIISDFADLLVSEGVIRGLLGPREVDRIWERHLLNCAVVERAFPSGTSVCDVGSGGGLPGIVLAILRPDLELILIEPLLRRSQFLQEAISGLRLSRARVVRARAEDLAGKLVTDSATARAVAPLGQLARWSLPLIRPGGRLVAIKGETAEAELRAAEAELRRLGARRWAVETFGVGLIPTPTRAVVVEAGRSVRQARSSKSESRKGRRRRWR